MNKEFTALHFELTNKCNLRCSHCYNIDYLESENIDLSTEEAKIIIDKAKVLGCHFMGFSGGEPFIREDIFELIEYVKEHPIHILTNGMYINDETIRKLSEIGDLIIEFRISVDGLKKHEELRGVSSEVVLENIKSLLKNEYIVTVNTMITNENVHELFDMYNYFKAIKIDRWRLDFIFNQGNAQKNKLIFDFSPEQLTLLVNLVKLYIKEKPEFEMDINKLFRSAVLDDDSPIQFDLNSRPCSYQGSLTVRPTGDVSFCPSLGMTHGNLINDSLDKIFSDKSWNDIVGLKVKDLNATCLECDLLCYCGGGCRSDALYDVNDLYGYSEGTCKVVKVYASEVVPLIDFTPHII